MNLVFQLRFHTRPGQDLFIQGDHSILGGAGDRLLPMAFVDSDTWEARLTIPEPQLPENPISYSYVLREPDGTLIKDWGVDRSIVPASYPNRNVRLVDSWNNPAYIQNTFYTEPFARVLLKNMQAVVPATRCGGNANHVFSVKAPLLRANETLCLIGSSPELGQWSTNDPLLLSRIPGEPACSIEVELRNFPVEYKYGIYDLQAGRFVRFENGPNRRLQFPWEGFLSLIRDGFADLPSTTWKGAGVNIPVFSLRSEAGFGIGEFADLKLLTDWCVATGLSLIQILPVNDTSSTFTWRDSYPYAAISAFALHPVYLRLSEVATTRTSKARLASLETERRRFNNLANVDYEVVARLKFKFLRDIVAEEKEAVFAQESFKQFLRQNSHWLIPYALFCCFRDKYGTSDFSQWGEHKALNHETMLRLSAPDSPFRQEIELVYFTQFHLHRQLEDAALYAHKHGVILKGDIPIGVARNGADAWQAPELFHMEMQAGAPPDAFATKGQNWGFPTYNWPRMRQDNFAWWKQRFSQMSRYFDAFRIDHILGFFRIWSIPIDCVEGILGHFVPALPVRGHEFPDRGIPFDYDRFVEPFITEEILNELFGPYAEEVEKRFLDLDQFEEYRLKAEFRTQRAVEKAVPGHDEKSTRIRQGLFDLISNVILLDYDAEGDEFHFRLGIETTSSFQALDPDIQSKLKDLYIDYFYRRQDTFWMREALQKLPDLKRVTNMLICGEDLGMVPDCVPHVMRALALLSLEIQRMPKNPATEFFDPATAPYLSVVTPSTHDMNTIRGWWEEDPIRTQRFYNEELGRQGPAPKTCTPELNHEIVQQHLLSPAMWSIFLLQDLLGSDERLRRPNPEDERINVPAIPAYYWRYRMHLTLEQLLKEQPFNHRLKADITQSARHLR